MTQLTCHIRDMGKATTHTLEHLFLECARTEAIQKYIFGDVHLPLDP